jgi:hypothetical protein
MQDNAMVVHMREYLGDTVLDGQFIEDVTGDAPAVHAEVAVPGGRAIAAELWLPLGAAPPDACLNLLHLLLSTESPSMHKLQARVRAAFQHLGARLM